MTTAQNIIIAIAALNAHLVGQAKQLAERLRLPITSIENKDYPLLLAITSDRIEIRQTTSKSNPMFIDFLSPKLNYRKQKGGGRRQLIAKAAGIKSNFRPTVIDATAGFCVDAYVLACLGCKVHMLERSPIMAVLIEDALARAAEQSVEFRKLDLSFTNIDATQYLQKLANAQKPDVIYLDPMFPERSKSALNKKTMRLLHDLVGEDLDSEKLLEIALKTAKKRVVAKRPRLAPHLGNKKPDVLFSGKSCRFDVYITAHAANAV